MFSLFKRKKDLWEVPEWASFFDKGEYNKFIDAIEKYFYGINVTYVIGDGVVEAGPNDFGLSSLGLINLSQVCKQNGVVEYEAIVSEHFNALVRTNKFDKELKTIIDDFDSIKEYIGVRLYPDEFIENVGKDKTIGKWIAGNVFATLVLDLPDSTQTVLPEQAEKWGKTYDQLLDWGIQNIKDKYPSVVSRELFKDFNIWLIQADHFFVPNIIFDLDNQKTLIGSHGILIGIPHRHAAIIYPIENLEVVKAITALIPVINGMYEEGPGSISNNLFYFKDGQFENLPYQMEEGKLKFTPTENFLEVLNTLESAI